MQSSAEIGSFFFTYFALLFVVSGTDQCVRAEIECSEPFRLTIFNSEIPRWTSSWVPCSRGTMVPTVLVRVVSLPHGSGEKRIWLTHHSAFRGFDGPSSAPDSMPNPSSLPCNWCRSKACSLCARVWPGAGCLAVCDSHSHTEEF